ncbi:uncharacterized protein Bfra_012041 [Botrytis fragariae]|uniref:Uncharacterized protein n=1 Tax=Botrytis fragariae TaxID=1964551 RepID=A0A8H6EE94_9HELO|nr:uncharacterized protein Bfra_012041 [Botrytis fragariae]KAF5868710.1 hypothetical protein Bfra_012041 [Botrytis fragariae]
MPQPSQGTGKDPSQRKRTRLDPIASMKNKTNAPAVIAATKAENDAKKSEFAGLRKVFEVAEANIKADIIKQERQKLRERIEKNVAHARAKQNKEEEELRKVKTGASSVGKKRPERTSSTSSTDKPKGKGTVKKQVT